MQYVLFSTFMDEETGRLILPYQTVATLVNVNAHSHGFSASKWLDTFSVEVMPLDVSQYAYAEGQARTITPQIAPDILDALRAERTRDDDGGKVWFDTGIPVSRRNLKANRDEYEQYLLSLSLDINSCHPAHPLIQYLLRQPQDTLQKVLNQNWPLVKEAVYALPMDSPRQQKTRLWCERVADNLETFRHIYYTDSLKTPRIFAAGANIHQLPRALRRLAFAGETECDLRACQLAVVARLWDIPELQEFLDSGESIWSELLAWVGMPPTCKPIIKRTVYSIVFCMGRKNLTTQLANGDTQDAGIGTDAAQRFFRHPLMNSLLKARGRQQKAVWEADGCKDAWGNWIKASWDVARKKKDVPSVLACSVQSYELRIMMSILPILESEPQVSLLSWLHDGCTIHFGNITKQARQEERMQAAVRREADMLGMATWLEVEHLPTLAQVVRANPTLRLAV